ncbi:MAG: hypothetical protein ACREDJ_01430 [Methylocella sp.]
MPPKAIGTPRAAVCTAIPHRSNRRDKPKFFAKLLSKARARIEQTNGNTKRFKRIPLRRAKTARNYASFIALACGFILLKSVRAA